jgi:tartrate dehydratase alpha subunit/fumarate hydratase class I-like protein
VKAVGLEREVAASVVETVTEVVPAAATCQDYHTAFEVGTAHRYCAVLTDQTLAVEVEEIDIGGTAEGNKHKGNSLSSVGLGCTGNRRVGGTSLPYGPEVVMDHIRARD